MLIPVSNLFFFYPLLVASEQPTTTHCFVLLLVRTHRVMPSSAQATSELTVTATSVRQVGHDKSRCLQCGPMLTATSVLQVSHDKSRRLQCGPTLNVRYPPTS
ncbi:hypothetical protein PoB_002932000 [Plakobranchus ocellatus]|uniref:Secreted protein n=1 Tax=Plakobranchus ocellatus TaxID=259542 RepID=A0AAV4A3W7_9GAST|nr:hypothetical protein PoB_002932000 [Plakobranchus ocellatus]